VIHHIAVQIHGRYLVDQPTGDGPFPVLVGFHGYAEGAGHMLDALRRIRGERRWLLVSVQALNRFYSRTNDAVAGWMTREDRELAIHDNVAYVRAVVSSVRDEYSASETLVYVGFSQGVAMAYRAAAFVADDVSGIPAPAGAILLAGDLPPDVAPGAASLPQLLIGRGTDDTWYTEQKAAADLAAFDGAGLSPSIHVFDGGHKWDDSFVAAAGQFLDRLAVAAAPDPVS
jgi:predicted esterase